MKRSTNLSPEELRRLAKAMREVARRSQLEGDELQSERFDRQAEDYEKRAKKVTPPSPKR